MAFGTSPEAAGEVTKAVKAASKKPVYMKLSPNVGYSDHSKGLRKSRSDGLSLINTLCRNEGGYQKRKPALANISGGLSERQYFDSSENGPRYGKAVNIR
jgi:dihydroorotate dehydrogenase (NAD+) catalytic subunit